MLSKIVRRSKHDSSGGRSSPKTQAKTTEIDGRDIIWSVAFLEDGKHIVSGGKEGRIRRWRVEDGAEVGMPMDAGSIIAGLVVSGDGKWVINGTGACRVTFWNAEDYSKVKELKGHSDHVYSLEVSPDATRLATGSHDGTVRTWSLPHGQPLLGPLQLANSVVALKFSPDGRMIATALSTPYSVRIYNSQDGTCLVDVSMQVGSLYNQSITWGRDSKQLFVLSPNGNIHRLDASSGATLSKWRIHSSAGDAKCVALASNDMFIAASAGSLVTFWDTTTGKRIGPSIRHPSDIEAMAISKNYDIVIGGGKKITLRNLCDVVPSSYYKNVSALESKMQGSFLMKIIVDVPEQEMQRTKVEITKLEESFRAQEQDTSNKIAHLETTVQKLRKELVESRSATNQSVNTLNETIKSFGLQDKSSKSKFASFEQTIDELRTRLAESQRKIDEKDGLIEMLHVALRAHEQQHRCEALFFEGHIYDAAVLIATVNMGNHVATANLRIFDWVTEFTRRCTTSLEGIGDNALKVEQYDEVLKAYSVAISLGPSNLNTLLIKWASTKLTRGSADEALGAAAEFKLPKFLVYQAICDVFERDCRIQEAIEFFRRMQHELAEDKNMHVERVAWESEFRARCVGRLEKLGDTAMDSQKPDEAIGYYTSALTLDPTDLSEILVKRSKARAAMGSWEEALVDADKLIEIDPSCYKGYERKYIVLHGMGQYSKAFEVFRIMLSKLEQSPDPHISDLRDQYVDATSTIRCLVQQSIRHLPRVLIDTTTGRLHDKTQQAAAFEELPVYDEMRSSMTTQLDRERIEREVKKYYRYVMLSHRWEDGEPHFQMVEHISVYDLEESTANNKLQKFCSFMRSVGFRWVWSDTCCINKKDNVVLQESLVAMFTWYHGSSLTIVYLRGIFSESQRPGDLQRSNWNTRAWTYQEYVAAENVQFYTEDWKPYLGLDVFNHKGSPAIISEMEQVSGISAKELAVLRPGLDKVREKLFLASTRQTTLVEDIAYSLLGIFHAAIPVIYGEGTSAVGRLLEYVLTGSRDVTILAWTGRAGRYNSCLPLDLSVYQEVVPPHISQLVESSPNIDRMVTELSSSLADLSLVVALHDKLHEIPSPSMSASRLHLSGIVFPITNLVRTTELGPHTDRHTYRARTSMLGDVEIHTGDDLTGTKDLCLVHPWIRPLLDQEFLDGAAGLDLPTKALRLVARLMQPFGALLFAPVARVEHRRVAADGLIVVQVRKGTALSEVMESIRAIEVV